jgi:molybdopterin/thiamine biosynthesis adenylyltransferase
MPNIDDLADRHLRPDPAGVLAQSSEARQGRVLVRIERRLATSKAGQHALWMLSNLLARQFRLVTSLRFDVPDDIGLLPEVAAFGEAPLLSDAIMSGIRLVAGGHVDVAKFDSSENISFDVALNVGKIDSATLAPVSLSTFADGWRVYVGAGASMPDNVSGSEIASGPYLAACFTAAEVFKHLRGLRYGRGRFIDAENEVFLSLWSGSTASCWDALDAGVDPQHVALPAIYFAGAGAVAQAAALTLAGIGNIRCHATVIDHDFFDLTNDNRYAISTVDDENKSKAELLGNFLRRRGFSCFSYQGRWESFLDRNSRRLNIPELDSLERMYKYSVVLSCVDENGARHAIQNTWPEMVLGGSTYGLSAKATTYNMGGEELCLKCYNAVPDRNALAEERLREARQLSPSQREKFFRELGVDPKAANEHLRLPRCGLLSEKDLRRFAAGEPMMSVGFVSVAAGILLATQLVRQVLMGHRESAMRGAMLAATFGKPGIRWIHMLPQNGCDCQERRMSFWRQIWSAAKVAA